MATEKKMHPNFIKYMEYIMKNKNYESLAIKKSNNSYGWVATAQGEIGKKRIEWVKQKAKELNIEEKPGFYREVMYHIHPTKKKVCHICGKEMSLDYVYLNAPFIKCIKKEFGLDVDELMSIYDLIQKLRENNISESEIGKFLRKRFDIKSLSNDVNEIIKIGIFSCSNGQKKDLGPGCMSNFPDRFDGFHSYNRCCRSKEDTGRSKENLYSYGKDRRAYEYWSDGNIHAANKFMHSSFFANTSADHIGPISLGFIHDSRTLRKMSSGDNSSKRDRLLYDDVIELEKIESINDICAISWYSYIIWEYIKKNLNVSSDLEKFRNMLKLNMNYYMEILWIIKTKCGEKGIDFLIKCLLQPKYECFKYDYEFNDLGQLISQKPRKITDSTKKEFERFIRIALVSVDEYHEKENRKISINISDKDKRQINIMCIMINNNTHYNIILNKLKNLIANIEVSIIKQ